MSAGGCGLIPRKKAPPARAYADLDHLASLHPGAKALSELDEEIRSLASLASVKEELPPLALPPPVSAPQPETLTETPPNRAAPEARSFVAQARQAGEIHLQSLSRELAETRARKMASRRQEFSADLEEEMSTEQARLQEPLWDAEEEIFQRFRRRLFNLRVSVEREGLPPEEKKRLESELEAVEAERQAALDAVRQESKQRLAAIREEKTRSMEEALARHEAQLLAEDEAILAGRRAQMEKELQAAAARLELEAAAAEEGVMEDTPAAKAAHDRVQLSRQLRAHRAQAESVVTESREALLSKLRGLKAARARLWEALQEEVKATLEDIGDEHGVTFIFDPDEAKDLPDLTPQAADWLQDYWQQAEPDSTADSRR